jgi:ABC-type transporter Mla subunit MlaD
VRLIVDELGKASGGFSTQIGDASNEVANALVRTTTNLQSVATECERIVRTTESTVKQFQLLVTGMSAATADIVSAHDALKGTAQPLQTLVERAAGLIHSVDHQVSTIRGAAESLQNTSAQMSQMQDTLGSSWRDYETRFADVDKSLGASLSQLRDGFDLYGEKIRDLNAGLDANLSKALSDLSSVISELHESFEELHALPTKPPAAGQVRA